MVENKTSEQTLIDYMLNRGCSPIQYERYVESLDKPCPDDYIDDIALFFKIHPDYLLGFSEQPHEYFITPGKIGENIAYKLQELRPGKYKPEDVAINIGISLNEYWAIERCGHEPSLDEYVYLFQHKVFALL